MLHRTWHGVGVAIPASRAPVAELGSIGIIDAPRINMGYDLHITRAKFHATNEGHEIPAEEWLRYIESDPELKLVPESGQYFAQWSGKSKYPDPWFDWFMGNIDTKNPDKAIVGKMLQIAERLGGGARVQGDDGEFYDDTSEIPD